MNEETKGNKLAIFTIDGFVYLGKRKENVIKGLRLQTGSDDNILQDTFAMYLRAKFMDELVEQEVGVNGCGRRKLTQREKVDFKMVKAEFKVATDTAGDRLVTMVFDEFRGKKQ